MKSDNFPVNQVEEKAYHAWVNEISDRFRKSQVRAATKVNEESLRFNWSVGRDIVLKGFTNTYGSGFFAKFSKDMKKQCFAIFSIFIVSIHCRFHTNRPPVFSHTGGLFLYHDNGSFPTVPANIGRPYCLSIIKYTNG